MRKLTLGLWLVLDVLAAYFVVVSFTYRVDSQFTGTALVVFGVAVSFTARTLQRPN